jgi:TetR/AcrR family transcriptional repressor of mexJK operon
MAEAAAADAAPDTPPDEKTEAIVAAARKTFLTRGFDSASMDQIALTAGVSKRTVYNRFRSKEELFGAAITASCKNLLPVNVDDIEASLPPEALVRALGRQFLQGVLQPEVLALRRIASFESGRNPAIGLTYLEHGAEWMAHQCAPILARLAARGVYKIDDPEDAIWRLGALITEPLYTRVLLGDVPADLDGAIDQQIEWGVQAFKKIYAPD